MFAAIKIPQPSSLKFHTTKRHHIERLENIYINSNLTSFLYIRIPEHNGDYVCITPTTFIYWAVDKSLARPGKKEAATFKNVIGREMD